MEPRLVVYPPPEEQGFGMFGLTLMKTKKFAAYVMRVRSHEYHRGYKSGHIDGVNAGHSAEWHDGYNEGARIQNGVDLLNFEGKVVTVLGLLDTLRAQYKMMSLKDEQIRLLQNRVVSLQGIIRILDRDDESGDDE